MIIQPLIISQKSLLKKVWGDEIFKVEEKIKNAKTEEEREKLRELLPTEEEKNWMDVFRSDASELLRIQSKMAVCFDVEVLEMSLDEISFLYSGEKYKIKSPEKVLSVYKKLEISTIDAVEEFIAQKTVEKNGDIISSISELKFIDEMKTISNVIKKFFFLIF